MDAKFRRAAGSTFTGAGWKLILILVAVMLALLIVDYRQAEPPAKTHSLAEGDGLPPKAPNPWFYLERAWPQGRIPTEAWREAQIEARLLDEEAESSDRAAWQPAGPTNVGGRLTCMAVDPRDANTVYAGAAEGGVLRSRDGGQHWTPLFDAMPCLSIGAIALDPSNPDRLYVGTGEVNPGGGSVAYGGTGLYVSGDQGDSWSSLGLEETGSIGRIAVDPADPDRLFVAATGKLWETGPDRGVYRSLDGGSSWQLVLFVAEDAGCVDLVQRPDDPDVLFAAIWQRLRQPEAYDYGGPHCAIWKTSDGGETWNIVGGGLPTPGGDGGRIGLSLCLAQPDVICAVYADRTGYFDGLYRSVNGGASWSRTNDGALSSVFASYGWWFGNVRVHPVDPLRIFVLGLDFYRSTSGGSSWSETSGGMHVDHHGLAFGPGASPVIYNGIDGGGYRSSNGGSSWA